MFRFQPGSHRVEAIYYDLLFMMFPAFFDFLFSLYSQHFIILALRCHLYTWVKISSTSIVLLFLKTFAAPYFVRPFSTTSSELLDLPVYNLYILLLKYVKFWLVSQLSSILFDISNETNSSFPYAIRELRRFYRSIIYFIYNKLNS